jgi:hypothetical protein
MREKGSIYPRKVAKKKKTAQLSELAKSLFELAMLQTRNEGPLI